MYVILYLIWISGSMNIYWIQNVLRWNLTLIFTLILVYVKFHLHDHPSTNILSVVTLYCSNLWKQPWICTAYYTHIREAETNQIKSDGRGKQTSSSGHHSKSTKQILHSKGDQHIMFHDLTYHLNVYLAKWGDHMTWQYK